MIAQTHYKPACPLLLGCALVTAMLTGLAGCASAEVLPTALQQRLASAQTTADDHRAAARIYQQQAQQLQEESERYLREANSISQLEDTKGFRRYSLKTAARERLKRANELLQAAAQQEQQANSMVAHRSQP